MKAISLLLFLLPILIVNPPHYSTQINNTQMKIEVYEKIIGTEGFWRVAQDRNGVWWFLTPDNKKEFLNLVGGVNPSQLAHNTGGPHYVGKNSEDKESWADEKVKQVK